MEALFLQIFNMSITASWLVSIVLLVRLLFKKAPKAWICVLWAVVALRLICPFSFESVLSLIPSAEPIPQDILYAPTPSIDSGIPAINQSVNPILSESMAPTPGNSVNPMQVVTAVAANVWMFGVMLMLVYAVISYIRVYRKVRICLPLQKGVYECDQIDTPFILGIVRPHIYLPSSLSATDRSYVLAHEQAHLKRLDHVWKPFGFALLSVYWFNPLLWVAYILLCRDIELACDERVIHAMDKEDTAAYTEALLHCSSKQRFVTVCPLAFGESGVKARIKNALSYKKPAFWIVIAAVIVCMVVAVCFLTDPIAADPPDSVSGSNLEGVSLSVEKLDLKAEKPTVTILWRNDTAHELMYGNAFRLYRMENGQLVDADLLENRAFTSIGYTLSPQQQAKKQYLLHDYDLRDGTYRFESSVLISDGDATSYKVWVEFTVDENVFATTATTPPQTEVKVDAKLLSMIGKSYSDIAASYGRLVQVYDKIEGGFPTYRFENSSGFFAFGWQPVRDENGNPFPRDENGNLIVGTAPIPDDETPCGGIWNLPAKDVFLGLSEAVTAEQLAEMYGLTHTGSSPADRTMSGRNTCGFDYDGLHFFVFAEEDFSIGSDTVISLIKPKDTYTAPTAPVAKYTVNEDRLSEIGKSYTELLAKYGEFAGATDYDNRISYGFSGCSCSYVFDLTQEETLEYSRAPKDERGRYHPPETMPVPKEERVCILIHTLPAGFLFTNVTESISPQAFADRYGMELIELNQTMSRTNLLAALFRYKGYDILIQANNHLIHSTSMIEYIKLTAE